MCCLARTMNAAQTSFDRQVYMLNWHHGVVTYSSVTAKRSGNLQLRAGLANTLLGSRSLAEVWSCRRQSIRCDRLLGGNTDRDRERQQHAARLRSCTVHPEAQGSFWEVRLTSDQSDSVLYYWGILQLKE